MSDIFQKVLDSKIHKLEPLTIKVLFEVFDKNSKNKKPGYRIDIIRYEKGRDIEINSIVKKTEEEARKIFDDILKPIFLDRRGK